MSNHFKIIIPLYNVEEWIKICLRSVKAQTYQDYQCIIVDDISTDGSADVIKKEIASDDRFLLVENKEKKYALRNIYEAIELSNPAKEDIIVTLDGDDWLASRDVLSTLNEVYSKNDCWITYGSYAEYPSGRRGKFSKQIPQHIISESSYRRNPWSASHLRTFKYKLWSKIEREDLLDSDGNFYEMAWDLSFMFPMLEMAGPRSLYVQDILYSYNLSNPLNDHKKDHSKQLRLESEIRGKNKYDKIEIIYCYLKGGLGNMMFQIAAAINLAIENNMTPSFPNLYKHLEYLDDDKIYNNSLNHAGEYLKIFESLDVTQPLGKEAIISYPFYYEKPKLQKDSRIIEGFFQSEKYFSKHSEEIKKMLKIPPSVYQEIRKKYSNLLDHNTTSIHVRRGDYLDFPDHHTVLGTDYYEKAIQILPKSDFYLVFSDDIPWCKENFKGEKFVFIENERDYVELYLMSLCSNNIIANSSFSWWGAWLNPNNDKKVVAPNKWFGSKIGEKIEDIIPNTWIKI
jgi:glycosyltransferase involved in cell wall biosynthesis